MRGRRGNGGGKVLVLGSEAEEVEEGGDDVVGAVEGEAEEEEDGPNFG